MKVDAARAKSIFLNASDLADPAARAAFLDRECGGDAELRGRVEALLRANDAERQAVVAGFKDVAHMKKDTMVTKLIKKIDGNNK